MIDLDTECPENRCGFELRPEDVGKEDFDPIRWEEETNAVCCWRPIWEKYENEGRCIWHADVDEKSSEELSSALADLSERLDGAILRGITVDERRSPFKGCNLKGSKFNDAKLAQSEFTDTDLKWAEFTDTDLWNAEFTNADLRNAIFTDSDLRNAVFTDADLRNTKFIDDDIKRAKFSRTNLRAAKFSNVRLRAAEFINANLRWAEFSEAYLWMGKFTDADLWGVQFTNSHTIDVNFTNSNLWAVIFTNTGGDADFINANLKETKFSNASFKRSDFTNANLWGAEFSEFNVRESKFAGADLRYSEFTDTDLGNSEFTDADLRWAGFSNANLKKSKLTDADLRKTKFTNSDLQDTDLSNTNAREAKFHYTNLQNMVLTRADCREATFTNASLYETVFSDTRINSQTTFYETMTSRPICIYEEDPNTADHLYDDISPLEAARWVYRRLETLHEDNALSEEARQYHVSKEEAERALYGDRFRDGDYSVSGSWLIKTFMWYVTKHGESVKRVLVWWVLVIATAGLLFSGLGGVKRSDGTHYAITSLTELGTGGGLNEVGWNLYFSVTTFSTIMDGGLAPVGPWTRAIVAVESLAGIVLTALFVFVLGRRTAR